MQQKELREEKKKDQNAWAELKRKERKSVRDMRGKRGSMTITE